MIQRRIMQLFACLLISWSSLYATNVIDQVELTPPEPAYVNWVFSGVVTNENGDSYGYFFQMQREGIQYHSIAAILDGQTKQVLVLDESEASIANPTPNNWHVGRAFLRHNPINDSWIFGLKTKDKKGFNFKIDMLKPEDSVPTPQDLRRGVALIVHQTSHLNGHLQAGSDSKEQFVTGKNAWFRQVWLSDHQGNSHPFSGVLCRFIDGSGFYSVNLLEADALRGAVTGWRTENGSPATMSQFILVKQQSSEGPWHIRVASPNLHLVLADYIKQNSVIAGFVTKGKMPGFCMISKETLGGKGANS